MSVYLRAAQLVDKGNTSKAKARMQQMYYAAFAHGLYETSADVSTGCCLAIDVVAGHCDSMERAEFEDVFRPRSRNRAQLRGYWFGSLKDENIRNERVLALLFMHEMTK